MVRVHRRTGKALTNSQLSLNTDDSRKNVSIILVAIVFVFLLVVTFGNTIGPVVPQSRLNTISSSNLPSLNTLLNSDDSSGRGVANTAAASDAAAVALTGLQHGLRGLDAAESISSSSNSIVSLEKDLIADETAAASSTLEEKTPAPVVVQTQCGPRYRGVLDPAGITSSLDWVQDTPPLFAHALVADTCKKWLSVSQNHNAGAGHRLRQWLTALNVVTHLPPSTRVAFAHTSLDANEGSFKHHAYTGFDDFLGLTLGENGMDGDKMPAEGIAVVDLPRVHANSYAERDTLIMTLEASMSDKGRCNVLYVAPKDHWAEDHSTQTRGVCTWKFAAAAKARAAAGARLSLLLPDEETRWDPSVVHIGVHWRVNDGKLISEDVLAAIISSYVFPALATAGVSAAINIHIFTEKEGEGATPQLVALSSIAADMNLGVTSVHIYSDSVSPRDALWRLSQTDFFIGSVSSFSWIVAQFSTRPASLLQIFPDAGKYQWCLTGMGCCEKSGACDWEAKAIVAATALRLAEMEKCNQLTQASWEDEARLPDVKIHTFNQKKASGLIWPGNW